MNKNKEIQRLRGIAVIMVVITHGLFLYLFPLFMRQSFGGVDIFFAISGFVVTLSLFRLLPDTVKIEPISKRMHQSFDAIKIFYIRRLFRILPLAVIWMLIYLALSIIFSNPIFGFSSFGKPENLVAEILGFFSGTYNYLVSYGLTGNFSHYWSLAVEEQFYLILPLFFVLFNKFEKRIIVISLTIFSLLVVVPLITGIFPQFKILKLIFAQRYFTLLFGVLLAFFYVKKRHLSHKKNNKILNNQLYNTINPLLVTPFKIVIQLIKSLVVVVLILVVWVLPGIVTDSFTYNAGFVVMGVFSAGLVYLASREEGWVLEIPILKSFLEFIGGRSYFIYLSHFAFIKLGTFIFRDSNLNILGKYKEGFIGLTIQNIIILFVMLCIAQIFYLFIEIPCINLGKKYISYKYNITIGSIQVGTFP